MASDKQMKFLSSLLEQIKKKGKWTKTCDEIRNRLDVDPTGNNIAGDIASQWIETLLALRA